MPETPEHTHDREPYRPYGGWGVGIALGFGIGVALGVSTGDAGVGIVIGVGVGLVFALAFGAAKQRADGDRAVPPGTVPDPGDGDPPAGSAS